MPLDFEWDEKKAALNERKHGITFEEAVTVFGDPLAAIFDEEVHSAKEQGEIIIGQSIKKPASFGLFYGTWRQNAHYQCASGHQKGA